MGSTKAGDELFGKRVKEERDRMGWTQAQIAKMLCDIGIRPMHGTTVAKIEAGDRSVRINEAMGFADLFEIPVESLVGRVPHGSAHDSLISTVRGLLVAAHGSISQVAEMRQRLGTYLGDIFTDDECDEIVEDADRALTDLERAQEQLAYLTGSAERFLETMTASPRRSKK
jgi:transcriptional regulator with XRE-family HTH domain